VRRVVWYCWSVVYWPFLAVGIVFLCIATGIYTVGEWLHDLLLGFCFKVRKS
jgi:hypothetical protein